jgi:hypothetical protein
MKKRFMFALLILTGMGSCVLSAAEKFTLSEPAKQALREQAQQMMDAAKKEDDAVVLRFMYPKVVEKMGGIEQTRKMVEAARLSMKKDGATLISTAIGDIRGCEKVDAQFQCVIEGTQVIRISGGRLASQTEMLAFSDDGGKNWTFLHGGQDPKVLRTNLPELSPNLPLRAEQQPKFEKD